MKNKAKKISIIVFAVLALVVSVYGVIAAPVTAAKYVVSDMSQKITVDNFASQTQADAIPVIRWLTLQLSQDDLKTYPEIQYTNGAVYSIFNYWRSNKNERITKNANPPPELNSNGGNWGTRISACMRKYSADLGINMEEGSGFAFKFYRRSYDSTTKIAVMDIYFVNTDISAYTSGQVISDVYACLGVSIEVVSNTEIIITEGEYCIGYANTLIKNDAGTYRVIQQSTFVKERDI